MLKHPAAEKDKSLRDWSKTLVRVNVMDKVELKELEGVYTVQSFALTQTELVTIHHWIKSS